MDCRDAFAWAVYLTAEDGVETGWSRDPSKRDDIYKHYGILIAPLRTDDAERDPMLTPPPAASAEEQLAELRAAMRGEKPESPVDD